MSTINIKKIFSSSLTNLQKFMCLFSLHTNILPTSINDKESVLFLCAFEIAKLLNLSCAIVDLSQVLRRIAMEKDLSPEALVAGFT